MELTEKTMVLFPKALVPGLRRVAKARHVSVGRLIREACSKQYGLSPADGLARLALPVADTASMKRELVPSPGELMP